MPHKAIFMEQGKKKNYSQTISKSQVSNTCFSSSAVPWTGTEGFPLISPRVIASYSCKNNISSFHTPGNV